MRCERSLRLKLSATQRFNTRPKKAAKAPEGSRTTSAHRENKLRVILIIVKIDIREVESKKGEVILIKNLRGEMRPANLRHEQ